MIPLSHSCPIIIIIIIIISSLGSTKEQEYSVVRILSLAYSDQIISSSIHFPENGIILLFFMTNTP
jgi:hypothetical protein